MSLKVVVGPMSAGKTSANYRYVERALRAKKTVMVVIPTLDKENNGHGGKTRTGKKIESLGVTPVWVRTSRDLYDALPKKLDLLVVEEAQFFDMDLPLWLERIQKERPEIHIIVAGLDLTSEGAPFGPMGHLMCIATKVKKLKAICECGKKAPRTRNIAAKDGAVRIGADGYVPACLVCWHQNR
jgi:thymidine kinase